MRDRLLTLLFCLFCIAIAGLLTSVLAFGGHSNLVQNRKERQKTTFVTDKSVENSRLKNKHLQSGEGTVGFIEEMRDVWAVVASAVTTFGNVRGCM